MTQSPASPATSTESATLTLATYASRLLFEELPPDVLEKAKLSLLDTLGCCIHGSTLPFLRPLFELAIEEGARPVAAILGTSQRTSPSHAALLNGTAAHAFQLDEIHVGATLHPGSVAVPAVLALAPLARLSGPDFFAAMVAGYEVGIRIGLAADGGMFKRGYHNQGTTGALAAAAAAARALRLDAQATAHALGIAASQSAGLMAVQEGANTKSFHCGRAAESGVRAALLAARGFTGIDHVLDAGYGRFFDAFVDAAKRERLTEGLGRDWEIRKVGYKLWPASNGSITAMDVLSRIMKRHAMKSTDIEHITACVSTNTLHHCGWAFDPGAASVLAAQMNLRYGLAAMALDGCATPSQYTEARIRDPAIAELLPKITVRAHDAFDRDPALRLACRIELRARDGTQHGDETLHRPGTVENPVSAAQLEEKFVTLASPVLSGPGARACIEQVRALDTCPTLPEFGRA